MQLVAARLKPGSFKGHSAYGFEKLRRSSRNVATGGRIAFRAIPLVVSKPAIWLGNCSGRLVRVRALDVTRIDGGGHVIVGLSALD